MILPSTRRSPSVRLRATKVGALAGAIAVVTCGASPLVARADAPPPAIAAPAAPAPAPASPSGAPVAADASAKVPRPRRPAAPPKPPLPVEMTIVAASPDPPWTLRIKNVGEQPIRIAADTRLLTFELDTGDKRGGKVKCAAPASFRPSKFPTSRELYLDPGESYVEDFDPRLFCFGDKIDLLKGGTTVRAHLGWSKAGAGKPAFAAQGIDRPEAFAAARELSAPPILLSYAAFAPMAPGVGKPAPGDQPKSDAPAARSGKGARPASWTEQKGKRPGDDAQPSSKEKSRYGFGPKSDPNDPVGDPKEPAEPPPDDRNAGHVDVYVERYADAESPRDAVVSIRAVNEGRRDLTTALRGRMLSFTVEQLGPDNKARRTFECRGADRPHAMPIETARDIDAGETVSIPIMLSEICPRETFERPGLYRVRPRIDTAVEGEVLKRSPYIGRALAAQSALLRVASSRKPYQDESPKTWTPPPEAASADDDDDTDDAR